MERQILTKVDIERFAKNLNEAFKVSGLTQEKVASAAHMSVRTFQRLLDGDGNPTLNTMLELSQALKVPFQDLFGGEEKAKAPRPRKSVPDLRGASEILSKIADLPHYRQAFVLALIYRDDKYLADSPELHQAYRALAKVR